MASSAASPDELAAVPAPPPVPQEPSVHRPALVRASKLTGLPVVTLGGEHEVEIKDVVFDRDAGAITGFTLRKPGLLGGPQKQVLPIRGVHAIGPDAVMIAGHGAFSGAQELVGSGDDVLGDRIITDDGVEVGVVTDVIASVSAGSGDVVGFEVDPADGLGLAAKRAYLPLPAAMAISGEAIVAPRRARELLTEDERALGAAVDALRGEEGSP